MKDVLMIVLLLSGAAFILSAAVGLVRMPDVFCRAHAFGVAAAMGISLMFVALWVEIGAEEAGVKLLLGILFQFATIPVAGHLFSLVGFHKGLPRWKPGAPDHGRDKGKR